MNRNILLLIIVIIALFASSCKKEYVKTPYNTIENFTIKDAKGDPLKAVIVNNRVIVYWPPLQTVPDSITPEISVSANASISPASGKKIPFNSSVTFTVTAQDGSTQQFTLSPAINQPPLDLNFSLEQYLGGALNITGEYIIPDTNVTELYVINKKDNKATRLWGSSFNTFTNASLSIYPTPLTLDTGSYDIKLINGTQTITKGPFQVGIPILRSNELVFLDRGKSLKAGDELSINILDGPTSKYYTNQIGYAILDIVAEDFSDSQYLVLPVSSQTATNVKFKIPEDVIVGFTRTITLISKDETHGSEAWGSVEAGDVVHFVK
ncbi:hypothetical protein GCM10023149_04970 [Mucilaginibacter gynuensis]|uniref:DUF5018 domain-containing protein n=1 Tax=Mucilaginibacter gynuensis TaxID=1302236 RepID=A0ABP8FST9_9SPHI